MPKAQWGIVLRIELRLAPLVSGSESLCACGPRAHIPPRPLTVRRRALAKRTAPRSSRVDSHLFYTSSATSGSLSSASSPSSTPRGPIIAYHLLWRDDVHGAWIPFTVPTDEEIVWVGYDASGAPTDIWTYWHGKILHADWRGRGTPAVDVQWGKHGLLPRGIIESDLPRFRR